MIYNWCDIPGTCLSSTLRGWNHPEKTGLFQWWQSCDVMWLPKNVSIVRSAIGFWWILRSKTYPDCMLCLGNKKQKLRLKHHNKRLNDPKTHKKNMKKNKGYKLTVHPPLIVGHSHFLEGALPYHGGCHGSSSWGSILVVTTRLAPSNSWSWTKLEEGLTVHASTKSTCWFHRGGRWRFSTQGGVLKKDRGVPTIWSNFHAMEKQKCHGWIKVSQVIWLFGVSIVTVTQ